MLGCLDSVCVFKASKHSIACKVDPIKRSSTESGQSLWSKLRATPIRSCHLMLSQSKSRLPLQRSLFGTRHSEGRPLHLSTASVQLSRYNMQTCLETTIKFNIQY